MASGLTSAGETARSIYESAASSASSASSSASDALGSAWASTKAGSEAASEAALARWTSIKDSIASLKDRVASSAPSAYPLADGKYATMRDLERLEARLASLDSIAKMSDLDKLATKEDLAALSKLVSELASASAQKVFEENALAKRDTRAKSGWRLEPGFARAVRAMASGGATGSGEVDEEMVRSLVGEMLDAKPKGLGKDEILALVRQELEKLDTKEALLKQLESKLADLSTPEAARPDCALSSAGAEIVTSLTTPTYEKRPDRPVSGMLSRLLGVGIPGGRPPVEAISKGEEVGECWAMNGGSFRCLMFNDLN